ncbi:LA_2272 family surface repeat-containing protein [Chondromyces apiculatus]|uniref:Uncharacterized protein n=1 Tax=Chondromyces apiculatus DSM 436 TaxID=1192034 RepID=A0A017SUT0_9BACT|nr:hypothetical protein [Chondromyces apiculatus]EYF00729.1 Hypothetical protein CAP_0297 [Chondromyces apiculatus DSM 436]
MPPAADPSTWAPRAPGARAWRRALLLPALLPALLGAALGHAPASFAADPAPPPGNPPPSAAADADAAANATSGAPLMDARLVLVLAHLPPGTDAEQVRSAIARELGMTVTLAPSWTGPSALVLRRDTASTAPTAHRAALTFHAEDGRLVERAVDLPANPAQAVEVIALLAGNLVRNEAAELSEAFGQRLPAAPPLAAPAPRRPSPEQGRGASPPTTNPSAPGLTTPSGPSAPRSTAPSAPSAPSTPPAPSAPSAPSPCGRPPSARASVTPFGLDLAPFVGTSTFTGVHVRRNLALNLTVGLSEGPLGFELGGLNIATQGACGVQAAVGANLVTAPVSGWQLSVLGNTGTALTGVQTSAGANVSTGDAEGLQLGGVNVTTGALSGVQLGLANITTGTLSGVQFGAVNIAAQGITGLQLGVVNIAPRSTLSLGVLTIIPEGRTHVDLWATDEGFLMAGLKHGGDAFHNLYGAGIRPGSDGVRAWVAYGLGGHLDATSRLFVDVDLLSYSLIAPSDPFSLVLQLRAVLGVRLLRGVALFGGLTFNQHLSADPDAESLGLLGGARFHEGDTGFALRAMWPGFTLGVQGL